MDTKKKNLELSCKLFTDDIEEALLKLNHHKVDLGSPEKNNGIQKEVESYLHERFKILINGIAIKPNLIGFEVENEVTWFYLEASVNVKTPAQAKIDISNSLLYDFIPEQTNIIHFTWNDKEQTEKLTNPDKGVKFEF